MDFRIKLGLLVENLHTISTFLEKKYTERGRETEIVSDRQIHRYIDIDIEIEMEIKIDIEPTQV